MKTMTFLILYAGLLISLDAVVLASDKKQIKEEVVPPRPSFPLFMLPSFSFPNFPYLQALSDRGSSVKQIRATKTEYIEETRRQTVHPVCYTAYEAKSPCLPFGQSDLQDDYDGSDFETIHQTHENLNFNEVRNVIRSTPTSRISYTEVPDLTRESNSDERIGKYLEFKFRREKDPTAETPSSIKGSEFIPNSMLFPNNLRRSTEHFTKTVLITKLEKYTDRRVTATLLAVNCLPVDRSIPMCQSYPSPILEAPDHFYKESIFYSTSKIDRNATDIEQNNTLSSRKDVDEATLREAPSLTHGNETTDSRDNARMDLLDIDAENTQTTEEPHQS